LLTLTSITRRLLDSKLLATVRVATLQVRSLRDNSGFRLGNDIIGVAQGSF